MLTTPPDVLLLDADGNLMASEEPAFDASAEVLNALLASVGSAERHTGDALRRIAMGQTFRRFSTRLAAAAGAELDDAAIEPWVAREKDAVIAHLGQVLEPDPEVTAVLTELARTTQLAVVSSSALARLDACFRAVGLADLLPAERRFSAEDSLPVPTSKPDPAVYLHALEQLGTTADRCLAIEDAESGALSAVAAGIPTVGNLRFVAQDERDGRRAVLEAAGCFAVVESWRELGALVGGS